MHEQKSLSCAFDPFWLHRRTFGYDSDLRLVSESLPHFDDELLSYTYEGSGSGEVPGRLSGYQVGTTGTPDASYAASWLYDDAGRLDQITGPGLDGGYVEYGYLADAPGLVETRTFRDDQNNIFAQTTHSYESGRNQIVGVENKSGSTTVSDYTYAYNKIGQRTHMGKNGTAFSQATHIAYTYDDLRQVTDAERFEGVNFNDQSSPVLPQTFAYSYDDIGNRLLARLGSSGSPIEETTYTTNLLNQYTAIDSDNPVFDDDGNLIEQDGWEYIWDGENRLIEAKVKTPTSSADRRLTFVYDAEGRRVEKKVYDWDNGWLPLRTHTFVWSGWDMLLEHIEDELAETSETIKYLWGLDLAGSQDVTGNVGALLAIETDTVSGVYFYDANGNVGQVIDVDDGSVIATYEYSPFGEGIASSGSFAEVNRFRFSTKYEDAETGWLYYGFRYYNPETGRWPSRDPIEEQGGLNLYGFVGNDGVNAWDYLGLSYIGNLWTLASDPEKFLKDKIKGYIKKHPIGRIQLAAADLGVAIGNALLDEFSVENLIGDLDLGIRDLKRIDDCLLFYSNGRSGLSSRTRPGDVDICLCIEGFVSEKGYTQRSAIRAIPRGVGRGVANFVKSYTVGFAANYVKERLGITGSEIPENAQDWAEDFAAFLADEIKSEVDKFEF